MGNLVYSPTGFIHLITAVIALITGTAVLSLKKGTKLHIKIGYVYVISMIIVNGTAFMIYRLFDGFGIFHIAAFINLLTVIAGMTPLLLRKPKNGWLDIHLAFMYWSVMGLYAAFVSEVLTRIPESPFFGTIGIATTTIMIIAGIAFYMKKDKWENTLIERSQKDF
jgi:uncharacterized membrane protein